MLNMAQRPFEIGPDHWLTPVRRLASPHCDERPENDDIGLIVVHAISLPAGEYGTGCVDALFTGCLDCASHPSFSDLEGVCVSSHLLIDRQGQVTQYVPFDQRAWHAGVSTYRGRAGCNDFAIGIELEGIETEPFEANQYHTLIEVAACLLARYPRLSVATIVGHQEIAPGRKTDPGPAFDWKRLYRGVNRWAGA
jgi:AmpD protein